MESTYNYYWLLDGCQQSGIDFHLGHALYMKAISKHKKKSDPIDAHTIANLMRTNFFPPAYAYPRQMRATRDLLRRRHRLVRIRAGAYAHIQMVFQQYAIPDIKPANVKNKITRLELVDRLQDEDIKQNIAADLELIGALDPLINKLEKKIIAQAKAHNCRDYNILLSIPGVGPIIALDLLYEIHDINRFKTVQKFSSYCRVVKCQRESDGKRKGGGNQKIGNPYLKWALSQIIMGAQVSSQRVEKYYLRLEHKYGRRRARAQIAHKFAVVIYYMLKHQMVFEEKKFCSM
ncbi:MAG: IS110-like element ISGsu4 family transposase [Calditrichia bacterium]